MNITIANAGTLTRIGTGPMCGADAMRPCTCGSELRSAVRYPVVEQRFEVVAPRDGDRDVADGVLEDQIPADDPRNEFAERRIGVRVCAARLRNHRSQLGVAQPGEPAARAKENERDDERGTRAKANDVAGRISLSRGRGADRAEDSGADHGPDREHYQITRAERALQSVRILAFGEKRGYRLTREQ
jgi:hypothetical protein